MKITFICEKEKGTVIHTTESVTLPEVLEDVKYFLLGAGYIFDGQIEIVEETET